MGSENDKPTAAHEPPVTKMQIKTYIMVCQNKLSLFRNKKVFENKKKKDEIVVALKQNNIDIAKAKMENILRNEDMITVYDILSPMCEILKEKVTYIYEQSEVPPEIRSQLDTLIYASSRIELDDLFTLRTLIGKKFGQLYLQKADANTDNLVNVNVVEKLMIKPPSQAFLNIRLKQLCREKQIKFDFPEELAPNFDGLPGPNNFGNIQCGGNNGNPYGDVYYNGGGNTGNPNGNNPGNPGPNPYNTQNQGQNPYNQSYDNFEAYMSAHGTNNMQNPYGTGDAMGKNPYENSMEGGDNSVNKSKNPYDF